MTYFAIPNLVSSETFEVEEPWNFPTQIPDTIQSKDDFRKWLSRTNTSHCVISGFEAVNNGMRVNPKQDNPAWKMHALVVDYDAHVSADAVQLIEQALQDVPALRPSWIFTSYSDHRRLIWEFEAPLGLGAPNAPAFAAEFLRRLTRELRLHKLLPGIDLPALNNPATYYEVGKDWKRINPDPLPSSILQDWFAESVELALKKGVPAGGPPDIPMDRIFERIEEMFPGRWPKGASLHEGARGPAVWDPSASNPTSCIYQKHGVYRFSSDKIFHSYAEIFGRDFVRQWETDKLGQATQSIFYGGKPGYFRRFPEGIWVNQAKEDIITFLNGSQGLSTRKPTPRDPSEVDRALLHIQHTKLVDAMMPFIYNPDPVVRLNNYSFINTARVQALLPTESTGTPLAWGQDFPWVAGWLGNMFEPKKQLVYFLCWLKLFWGSARRGKLTPGHALFLVGGTDMGKTLLNAVWLPLIMGGGADAGSFLVQGKTFNKILLEVGHWHIDDSLASTDARGHREFTERVKALVANPYLTYHPKYVDEQKLPWNGRLLVTLNEDPDSLQMLPDLDRNIEDKLIILQCNSKKRWNFTSRDHTEKTLAKETPHFLRWLEDWEPPKFLAAKRHRFGMRNFIHPGLREKSVMSGYHSDLLDVLEILWVSEEEMRLAAASKKGWTGTSAALASLIAGHPTTQRLLDRLSARGIGQRLAKLSKIPGSGITANNRKTASKKEPQTYTIIPLSQTDAEMIKEILNKADGPLST